MKEFSLQNYELCLLIPSMFGNDFIKQDDIPSHPRYLMFLEAIAKYTSPERHLAFESDCKITVETLKDVRQLYNLQLPSDSLSSRRSLPSWISERFKDGRFPSYLFCKRFFLPRVVEVIGKGSVWRISRHIREHLYRFVSQCDQVREILRVDHSAALTDDRVSPKCWRGPDPITCEREDQLQALVLGILTFERKKLKAFGSIGAEWKLPMAATFYWYARFNKTSEISATLRKELLQSLLLSFLTCSGHISRVVPPLSVTKYTKLAHLTALHAFAQWQCVYFDARALNYLAREPFPSTSPAHLYSGRVAMYYATSVSHEGYWLADIISRGSDEWILFYKLLYLITEQHE